MKALPIAGPVIRPALDSFRRELPDTGYSRQPIGRGPRPVVRTDPAKISTPRLGRPMRKRSTRRRTTLYASTASALLLTLALGIGATAESPRSLMSQQDFVEARRGLDAESRLALAQCRNFEGGEKDTCRAAARGGDRVRRAELEARYRGTVGAEAEVAQARARMRFEVAKAGCLARRDDRVACLAEARAERARALADGSPSTT